MLSEEEIKKLEELSRYCALKNIDREDDIFAEFVVTIQKTRNYTEQAELNKQELIEKLEERKKQNSKKYCQAIEDDEFPEMYEYGGQLQEDDYILKILKGEKKC